MNHKVESLLLTFQIMLVAFSPVWIILFCWGLGAIGRLIYDRIMHAIKPEKK